MNSKIIRAFDNKYVNVEEKGKGKGKPEKTKQRPDRKLKTEKRKNSHKLPKTGLGSFPKPGQGSCENCLKWAGPLRLKGVCYIRLTI